MKIECRARRTSNGRGPTLRPFDSMRRGTIWRWFASAFLDMDCRCNTAHPGELWCPGSTDTNPRNRSSRSNLRRSDLPPSGIRHCLENTVSSQMLTRQNPILAGLRRWSETSGREEGEQHSSITGMPNKWRASTPEKKSSSRSFFSCRFSRP